MLVEFQVDGDLCILRLTGRFATGQDTGYLREKTDEVKRCGCARVLVDFRQVAYIDSTGIGFLIGIYTSVVKNPGGVFGILAPNPRVLEVLELCRLDTVFPIYNGEAEAVAALKAGDSAFSGR
jgi:anti-sigma B factor antagonist